MSETFGEDTIVALYKRHDKPGRTVRSEIKAGEPVIPMGAEVDCLYALRAGTVKLVPGSSEKKPPLTKEFHGQPHRNMPIIGGRYFFTRRKSTIAYVAQTDVAIYAIDSSALVDFHNDRHMLTLMRELIVNSDIAEQFAPIAARQLDMPFGAPKDAETLAVICDEIRKPAFQPRLDPLLTQFFQNFMRKRRESAAAAGLEASVCTDPPGIRS